MKYDKLFSLIDSKKDLMLTYRRWLHQHPELSYEEKETSEYIFKHYENNKEVKVEKNIGGYGIKVTIDSGKPGKTLALRADFDALPITEETGLDYASTNKGVMHACGHDAHTAYLMVLADALTEMKEDFSGKIVIIHQPAEEMPPGGSSLMIKDGVLDGVDSIIGCHVMSQMDFGKIYYHKGPTQQARAKFVAVVKGTGGHGAAPHEANDAIVIASNLVLSLQTIVSRRVNPMTPGVVTIGSFDGVGQFNIIKDSVTLEGDVRCMSDESREIIEREVRNICQGMEKAFSCEIDLDYKNDYPVLINDDNMTQLVVDAVNEANIPEIVGIEDCGPQAQSEDFSYYSQVIPACFFYIGAKPDGKAYPHHHPKFTINEDSMIIAAKAMGAATLKYLSEK
ncbi:amidohydrolase [Citroniella saccharovorans]|uniref:Amidohydrolase n=1 Tax=Citroniella saccharovorans TaxID=2053367 RepID=A0AAW9N179_9FIRM|nr:amidohydrolase [Citroniella saccharovorans]MEB3430032.1 amidohydrolase [Citroniella saccharovorans]